MTTLPKDVVRAFHHRLWIDGDVEAIDEFVHPSASIHVDGFEDATRAAIHEDVERYRAGFADVRSEITALVGEGEMVAMWWRTTGRHTGPYGDIAPVATGNDITMSGVNLYRVVDGLVVEVKNSWDGAAVYRQFGLLPDGL